MNTYVKQAAFILAVYAVAAMLNKNGNLPVVGNYLPTTNG